MNTIRLPRRFLEDHADRELPTPKPLESTTRYTWVDRDDPALPEVLRDAEHYAHPDGPFLDIGLRMSAMATVRVLKPLNLPPPDPSLYAPRDETDADEGLRLEMDGESIDDQMTFP